MGEMTEYERLKARIRELKLMLLVETSEKARHFTHDPVVHKELKQREEELSLPEWFDEEFEWKTDASGYMKYLPVNRGAVCGSGRVNSQDEGG